jgi:hypothetical protein
MFVQGTVRDMDGRITVQQSADGETTTTLMFSVSKMVDR